MRSRHRPPGALRHLVLEHLPRRDAAQRLSLAYCLLVRDLASGTVLPTDGDLVGADAPTPAPALPKKEVAP
jgi:hypothetical protein